MIAPRAAYVPEDRSYATVSAVRSEDRSCCPSQTAVAFTRSHPAGIKQAKNSPAILLHSIYTLCSLSRANARNVLSSAHTFYSCPHIRAAKRIESMGSDRTSTGIRGSILLPAVRSAGQRSSAATLRHASNPPSVRMGMGIVRATTKVRASNQPSFRVYVPAGGCRARITTTL